MKILLLILANLVSFVRFLFSLLLIFIIASLSASLWFSFAPQKGVPPINARQEMRPDGSLALVLALNLQNRGLFSEKWQVFADLISDSKKIASDKKEITLSPQRSQGVNLELINLPTQLRELFSVSTPSSTPDASTLARKLKLKLGMSLALEPKLGQIGASAVWENKDGF